MLNTPLWLAQHKEGCFFVVFFKDNIKVFDESSEKEFAKKLHPFYVFPVSAFPAPSGVYGTSLRDAWAPQTVGGEKIEAQAPRSLGIELATFWESTAPPSPTNV